MSGRRLPTALGTVTAVATLALSAGALVLPAAAQAPALSPGCQRISIDHTRDDVRSFNIRHEFYAGEVISLTVSDFNNGADKAVFDVVARNADGSVDWDYFGPGQFFYRVGLTTTDPTTFTWTVPETRLWETGVATGSLTTTTPTADFTYACVPPSPALSLSAFEAPVDAAPIVNAAQAGRTIPFKFTVTDRDGNPVTDLTTDDVTPVTDLSAEACEASVELSTIETYTSGAGTLTHFGEGHYTYTLKTDKAWRGTCGTVGVNVQGVEQTATFQFRP